MTQITFQRKHEHSSFFFWWWKCQQMWKYTEKKLKWTQDPHSPSHLWNSSLSSHEAAMFVNQLYILRTTGGRECFSFSHPWFTFPEVSPLVVAWGGVSCWWSGSAALPGWHSTVRSMKENSKGQTSELRVVEGELGGQQLTSRTARRNRRSTISKFTSIRPRTEGLHKEVPSVIFKSQLYFSHTTLYP